MTTREAKAMIRQRLESRYPAGEVEQMIRIIFEHLMGWTPVKLALHDEDTLLDFLPARIDNIVGRMEQGEPIQYVLGHARFHGHEFAVTRATLIPRPETEQLVDLVVDRFSSLSDLTVLDIGTGTGCIAISLARALRFPRVTAIDVSRAALDVARENARELKVNVEMAECDILKPEPLLSRQWDVIVSNPPYVRRSERALMSPHVLDYEPERALFVDDDNPLLFYEAIGRYAKRSLTSRGALFLEINCALAGDCVALLRRLGLNDVELHNDFASKPRFITCGK